MTLVVTHAHGLLGCFTREPDGSMKQRAIIDTGQQEPTHLELAELGHGLAVQYGWAPVLNGKPAKALPAAGGSVKALKEAQKQVRKKKPHQYPPVAERQAMLLECLKLHPGQTIKGALALMGQPVTEAATGNWNHDFRGLMNQGLLRREGLGRGHEPYRYFLAGE